MAKQIKIVDKQKKDTQATTKLNTASKVQEGKDNTSWFKYYENQVLNDERFSTASEEEKKRYLNNLYDTYGKLLGADAKSMPPDEYAKKKADYVNGTFSKFTTEGIYDVEKKGTDTIPVMQTDTVPKVEVPVIAQDTTKPPKEEMIPPSQQPTGESDIIKQVKADAEKYYTDKGWPSPTWKLSEYEKGMMKIQSDYTSGKISPDEAQKASDNLVRGLGLLRDDKEGKVYISPTEVEMYREQVEKAYQRNLQDRAKMEKDPFMKDVLDALNIGANRVMTSPTRLLAVSESMGNGLMRLIGQKEKWGSTYWKDQADQEKALSQSWSAANMRYDSSIAEMIQSGNTAGAAGQTILSVAENLPMLTVLIMGNAMGATNVSLGYMGFDTMADEYITSKSDPNMTEFSRWVSALGKGMAEMVFENMGTASILNSVRKGVQEIGEQSVRDALLSGYTPFFTKLANMAMKGANNMTIEGMEEMSTQLVQNLIDISQGKDVKLEDGVLDAGIVGAAIGMGLSSPEVIANFKGKDAYTKRILDIVPDNMEFDSKVELIELLLKADKLHQEQATGVAGVEQINKEQINQVNQRIAELMGLMKDEGILEGEVSTSRVVPALNPEDLQIDPDYIEWLKEEREILDMKISESQARLGLPTTPDITVPDEVEETIDKIDRGEPVVNVRLKEASDFLYKEYKRLNIMKKSSRRMFTEDQINDMMDVLAEDITNLNNLINEQAESGEFKTKEVKLTDEVTVSQITEIGEGEPGQEQPVGEAGVEGEEGVVEGEPAEGEPGKAEPAEGEPKPIEITGTYGRPEDFMTKPVKEFSGTFKAEQRKTYAEIDKVEERIKTLKQRRDQMTGRLTTDQRILKKEIEDDIFRAEQEAKAWDQGFIDEANEYIDKVRPEIENAIDVIIPDATAEDREAIMGEYWTRMTEPTKEDLNLSMEDLLINIIDNYAGKIEKREPVEPKPERGEPKPETSTAPMFPEGYKPTIIERRQNWRYMVYQPDGESEASSLTLRKEPVETEDGKLLSVGILSTVTGEGGKGLGTNLMKYAMANLPTGIEGLIIPDKTITNTVQVPRILETMKKIYDVIEKPNGDIVIKNKGEKAPGEYRYVLMLRPFDIGTYPPEGFNRYESGPLGYGTLIYDQPLDRKRWEHFSLYPETQVEDIAAKEWKSEYYERVTIKPNANGTVSVSMYEKAGDKDWTDKMDLTASDLIRNIEEGFFKPTGEGRVEPVSTRPQPQGQDEVWFVERLDPNMTSLPAMMKVKLQGLAEVANGLSMEGPLIPDNVGSEEDYQTVLGRIDLMKSFVIQNMEEARDGIQKYAGASPDIREEYRAKWEKVANWIDRWKTEWERWYDEEFKGNLPEEREPESTSEGERMRKAGKRVVNGREVARQPELKRKIVGKAKTAVRFSKKLNPEAEWTIIDAKDLQPSHLSGTENPKHFIPEAQPRNRSSLKALTDAAREKAMNLDPQQLEYSPIAYTGAPIVNTRGEVIQGNGRAEAIIYYYATQGKDPRGYKAMILETADRFGFPLEAQAEIRKMAEPVLVRMLNVADETAIKLGNYGMKDLEDVSQESADIKQASNRLSNEQGSAISNILLRGQEAEDTLNDLIRKNSDDLIKRLTEFDVFSQGEAEKFRKNGDITPQGIKAIEGVIKGLFFRGGNINLPDIFEKLPYVVKQGMEKSIPILLRIPVEKNILPQIRNAIMGLFEYDQYQSDSGGVGPFEDWVNQVGLYDAPVPERYNPFELAVIKKVYGAKRISDIVGLFKKYEEQVKGKSQDLFEGPKKGVSREEAAKNVFGADYVKSIHDEYEEKQGEQPDQKPTPKPKEGGGAEEGPTPEVKIIEVKKDIDDMSRLLDDLDFDDGLSMAAGGEGDTDARTKLLNIANGLVDKMIKAEIYSFSGMIREILPAVEINKLKRLMPFLKQGYTGYWSTASEDIASRMNLGDVRNFHDGTLDELIAEMNKPAEIEEKAENLVGQRYFFPSIGKYIEIQRIEEWDDPRDQKIEMMGGLFGDLPAQFERIQVAILNVDPLTGQKYGVSIDRLRELIDKKEAVLVPPYDNPEYRDELRKVIDVYKKIGDYATAAELEGKLWKEPKRSLKGQGTWQEEIETLKRMAQIEKDRADILSGRVMYEPLPTPEKWTEQTLFDAVEGMVSRGEPITPYIKKWVPQAMLDRVLELTNKAYEFYAKLGIMDQLPAYLNAKLPNLGIIAALYPVGSKARAYENGREGATIEKVKEAGRFLQNTIEEIEKNHELANAFAFTWEIKNHILNAKPLDTWTDVVRIGKKWGITDKGILRDQYELALVEIGKTIARNETLSVEDRWTQLLTLYTTSPGISETARTSDVKGLQQYSTPLPLAFLLNEYLNMSEVGSVLEPSAGNGALLIGAKTKAVSANEIDPRRWRNLTQQGYSTQKEDSSHGLGNIFGQKLFDAVIMNPPFGGAKEDYNGWPMHGEYVPVAYALEHLKPTGKAAIIVGGHVTFDSKDRMAGKDLPFFNWLNKYFNVEDVIQVSGEMYRRMGASYPIKVILVNGRKAAPEGAAPLKSDLFNPITEWGDLKDRVLALKSNPNAESLLQSKVDAQRGDDSLVGSPDPGAIPTPAPVPNKPILPGQAPSTPIAGAGGGSVRPDGGYVGPSPNSGRRGRDMADIEPSSLPKPEGGIGPESGGQEVRPRGGFGVIQPRRSSEDLPVRDLGKPTERTKRQLGLSERTGDEVTPYIPLSRMGSGNYIVPASIAGEVETALIELRDEIGDIDEFVRSKLKYNSFDEMRKAFFAEQVDGIGQAIFNIEGGNAMIIGHQTGTGKGRIAAGVVRYAIENGKFPVFITKTADLFTDIFRDLIDIGSPGYKPFIMNKTFPTGQKVRIFDPDGKILHEVDPQDNDRIIGSPNTPGTKEMPEGVQMLFTTYSQFADKERDAAKREFLMDLARRKDVIFIMDESHSASGISNTGQFFMDWLQNIGGGLFLSATYAKRPDNMPLYAMKTVLSEANMTWEQLVDAIKQGGEALQEIISLQLAEAGQFSKIGFKMDAEMNYLILGDTDATQRTYNPDLGQKMVAQYDGVTQILQEIIDFQKVFVNPILDGMDEDIKRGGKSAGGRKGTSKAGIENSPYFSRVWQILDQLIVSIKVKDIVPLVIEDLKKGLKPVVTLKSTMEALFDSMAEDGDLVKGEMVDLDFSYVLKKGMTTVMKYTVKDEQGNSEHLVLKPEDLTPMGRQKYYSLLERIQSISTGIPLSPIDVLRQGIKDAGFDTIEITGRSTMFKLNKDMSKGEYSTNDRGDKIKALKKFNNNPGIAAIINSAGSTGISMHSSARFADQAQRSMYILQNDLDINVVVQILGRVYRADQVNKPIYNIVTSMLPAELRMFMMNAKKMKSLDANTSGNQRQSKNIVDIPDFLNKYGDEAVIEYLRENPDINNMIEDPCDIGSDEPKKNRAAHRVTYRMQILPSWMQDEFNKDVIDRYERKIEYLNSTGRNDLMVTSEDLAAEIKERETVIEGHGGYSVFGGNTILNVADVNVTRNPFSKVELQEELAKVPETHVREIQDAMEKGIEARLNEAIEKVNQEYEDLRKMWKNKIGEKEGLSPEDKEREYNLKVNELNQRQENRILALRNVAEENKDRFDDYLDYFKPGMAVYVPFSDEEQTDAFRQNLGVFLGFEVNMNKPNPWVPSNFVLKFATTDGRRMVKIPASKANHLGSIMHNSQRISPGVSSGIIDNWDKHQVQRTRETRYIITENVLQGLTTYNKGRLIQFTRADGTVDKGILMNENWVRPEDRVARLPIGKSADIIRDLAPGEFVESYGGDIIIKKMHRADPDRWYELKVPQSKAKGSKYYLNDNLRDLVNGRQFEQHGDRMVATFTERNLQDILDLLNDRFKITLEIDSKNVQLSRDQTQSYETMNSYGQPGRTKAKSRGELSNPHNDVLGAEERQVGTRIAPSPITGETPKRMWEIQYDFATSEGFKLRYARKPSTSRRAIGTYYPGTGRVVIKWHGDLNTTAHEMGHALDDMFGLVGPEAHNVWSDLKSELKDLWDFGSKPPQGHSNPEQYRMMEGMAEFIRAYVVNPFETQQRFPFTYDWVKQRISKDRAAWDALNQFSRDIRIWWGSTAADQILSRIDTGAHTPKSKFVFRRENEFGQFQLTTADRYARKYTNFFRPLEQAYRWGLQEQGLDIDKLSPSQNWIYLSRLLLGQDVKMRNAMEHGIVDFDGNRLTDPETGIPLSFHHMLSQIPNFEWKDMEANLDTAIKYGMAERIVEIPWKWQARQVRADLAAKGDYLPPESILRQHPFIYNLYSAKIQSIHDRMNKGELDPKDVYLPPERYDFTGIVISGVAQEGMTDYEIAKKAVQEYKDLQRTDPDKYKWIKEFNRIYREIGRNIMIYARDSGLISEASFEQIDNENLYYMAMKRLFVMDPSEIVNGMAQDSIVPTGFSDRDHRGLVQVVVHPIKGSRREIKNPVEALIEAYHQVVRNGDLNYSIAQFAKAFNAGRDPYMEQTIRVGEVAWVSKTPEQRNIPFFINGKRRYLVIPDPEMFELMRNLIPNTGIDSSLVKFLAWLPQKLRSSIIAAPVFALRNIIRDFQHFMVIGRGIRYLKLQDFLPNILKSKAQVDYTKRMTHLFETTGGGQFGYLVTSKRGYYDLMKEAMFKVSRDPKKWIYAVTQKDPDAALIKFKSGAATQHLYDKTFGWMMGGERVVRMLQFKAAVREGMSKIKTKEPTVDADGNVVMKERNLNEAEAVIRAAYLSRDLMDFMVGGTRVRELNQVILFLNPAIRGLDRIYRSTTDPTIRSSVLARMGLFLAIPGIINAIMIALWASDDEKEEYLSAPAYERDMFFRVPVNGGWVLIPRPFELAAITSIFQRITDKVILGDDNAFTPEYFKSIGHLISPVDVAGILGGYSGVIAALFNYDFFRQKHIVPPKDVDISVVSRNTAYASQFSQAIMEASDVFSKGEGHYLLDARKLDAFIQSQFSYYGNFFLKATELLIPGEGQDKFKFDVTSSGFFRYANAYAEPNTQWVLNTFKEHPALKVMFEEEYVTFSHLITAYFSEKAARNPQVQREVGKALREFSAAKREAWKDVDFYKLDKEWKQLKEAKRSTF